MTFANNHSESRLHEQKEEDQAHPLMSRLEMSSAGHAVEVCGYAAQNDGEKGEKEGEN